MSKHVDALMGVQRKERVFLGFYVKERLGYCKGQVAKRVSPSIELRRDGQEEPRAQFLAMKLV